MCLVRDEKTVGALQGVWIGLNLFYAGFVVLPQNFFSFFVSRDLSSLFVSCSSTWCTLTHTFSSLPLQWLGLWINASRYALEGIIFTQFVETSTKVIATAGSPFWFFLGCGSDTEAICSGSMFQYATYFFGGKFSPSNRGIDIGVLVAWNVLALFGTWFCLKKFNYVNT